MILDTKLSKTSNIINIYFKTSSSTIGNFVAKRTRNKATKKPIDSSY